jgi:cobalt-zinc-cadmium efflux system outer membrane protein
MSVILKFRLLAGCGILTVAAGCQSAPLSAIEWFSKPGPNRRESPAEQPVQSPVPAVAARKGTEGALRPPKTDVALTRTPVNSVTPAGLLQTAFTDVPEAAVDDEHATSPASSRLTLEAIEEIALQNNPAIQQAAAAAYKAVGFRDQVGRYPNPAIGYSGAQLADRGTDQHTAFIAQDLVPRTG